VYSVLTIDVQEFDYGYLITIAEPGKVTGKQMTFYYAYSTQEEMLTNLNKMIQEFSQALREGDV
jgi:hypothetical protein